MFWIPFLLKLPEIAFAFLAPVSHQWLRFNLKTTQTSRFFHAYYQADLSHPVLVSYMFQTQVQNFIFFLLKFHSTCFSSLLKSHQLFFNLCSFIRKISCSGFESFIKMSLQLTLLSHQFLKNLLTSTGPEQDSMAVYFLAEVKLLIALFDDIIQ